MRKHERRNGTYTQDIWTKDDGKRTEKLVRDKENPEKVKIDSVFLHGFKIELYYYKSTPDNIWIGIGNKCALLQEYEIKSLFRMFMSASNKMGITGKYCNKNKIAEFKRLMKEKNEKEEKGKKSWKRKYQN